MAATQQRGYLEAKITLAKKNGLTSLYLKGSMVPHHYQFRSLPPDLAQMSQLEELYLSYHKIDNLPASLDQFNLTNLTVLTLESNRLRVFPSEVLGSLEKLRILLLGHNHLEELPESVSKCLELNTLDLKNNLLTELPDGLSKCSLLRALDVTRNQVSVLRKSMGQLPILATLVLDQNGDYDVPQQGSARVKEKSGLKVGDLSGLTSLTCLSLEGSLMNKGFPPSLSSLTALRELRASFCFTRAMAKRKGSKLPGFDALEALAKNVAGKSQAGGGESGGGRGADADAAASSGSSLPVSPLLQKLEMRCNHVAELPEGFGKFVNLTAVDLSQNSLPELPMSLGKLVECAELRLDRNALYSFPSTIGSLSRLTTLCAHSNLLSGVPSNFASLTTLTTLDLSRNKLQYWPPEFGELSQLRRMELQENLLSSIPGDYIGGLQKLERLGLKSNKLASLPETIDILQSLESLDLSDNTLFMLPVALSRAKMPLLRDLNAEGNPCAEEDDEDDDDDEDNSSEDEDGDGESKQRA